MYLKSVIITASILTAFAGTANAADAISAYEPAPEAVIAPITPEFSWAGSYIGAQAGYVAGRMSVENVFESEKLKANGFIGGIYAGYNIEAGDNVILGADFDVNYANIKKTTEDMRFDASHQMRWNGAARARVGYAFDRFMPYIAGGLAVAKFKDGIEARDMTASSTRVQTGWTAGAGIDYAATDNLILRVEYRHSDFGKPKFNTDINNVNLLGKFTTNEMRVGAAYKF